jgi:two-component system phosphate regulon sensor histidine kinase PhoR
MSDAKGLSFFTKLFLGNLLLVGLIVAVGGLVSYRRIDANYQRELEHHQRQVLALFREQVEQSWPQFAGRADLADSLCKRVLAHSAMRLTIIAGDGRVLGDSEGDPNAMKNHNTPDRPEVQAALAGGSGRDLRRSDTLKEDFRYLAEPVRQNGTVAGVARVALPVRAILQDQAFLRDALLLASAAAVIGAVALALLLSWVWYAPLRQITLTARALASGDLSHRSATASSSRELVQLGAALNEMRDSLAARMEQVAVQRENLHTVIDSLGEAVIALDRVGRIALINRAGVELLAAEDAEAVGKHIQEVVRIPEVVDVVNEVAERRAPAARQVTTDLRGRRRTLEVHAAPLTPRGADDPDLLLVVRDISDLVHMAQVKAEFVANASHELRTPLATIRAAVDSLEGLGAEDAEELSRLRDILNRHTARLEDMTRDLLNLHALESGGPQLRIETVTPGALARWIRESFAEAAAGKDLALSAESNEPNYGFTSDAGLLRLILQNLVDNAIKFTAAGHVRCRIDRDGKRVVLSVRDTGCGIAPEIQDRVFERFFQADASRSGEPKVRGTGLGLAIVKHAAERLGADVHLESQAGKGTTITISIPAR